MKLPKYSQFAAFVVCFLLMAVVSINRSNKIFGIDLPREGEETEQIEPLVSSEDGKIIVNTTPLTKNIIGYAGTTPVEIIINNDKIEKIKVLPNNETPEFLGAVLNSDLFEEWYGKTLEEASSIHPDAISGATFTSSAVIKNIEAGIAYAHDKPVSKSESFEPQLDFKFFCVIFVILAAAILPFFFKNKLYRYIQLAVNVLVLGLWGGTFISYTIMTSLMTNGIKSWIMIPVMLMVVTAFIYPFFGKPNYYCNWICPYGSIQELAGKCFKFKIKVSARGARILTKIRDIIWVGLMFVMMAGLWFEWMDWEPFAAFFFTDVSTVALAIAGGFLIFSFFIQRPYCRFVCPTGSLFKLSEGSR